MLNIRDKHNDLYKGNMKVKLSRNNITYFVILVRVSHASQYDKAMMLVFGFSSQEVKISNDILSVT